MNSTGNEDKIVVYKKYENPMDANIAKTKLDAHGIPCFLSNELSASIYGNIPIKGMEIRLHIFEQDWQSVTELLTEVP
jgi:hypothetical protein